VYFSTDQWSPSSIRWPAVLNLDFPLEMFFPSLRITPWVVVIIHHGVAGSAYVNKNIQNLHERLMCFVFELRYLGLKLVFGCFADTTYVAIVRGFEAATGVGFVGVGVGDLIPS